MPLSSAAASISALYPPVKPVALALTAFTALSKMMEDMRKEASQEKAIETAVNMLKDNLSLEKTAQYSGLSLDEVKKLKDENNL